MTQLYLDMDGVLVDFDRGHELAFGQRPDKVKDDVDWDRVRAHPGFYENLPPMADAEELWAGTRHLRPIVLTGVPQNVPEAPHNKIAWVRKYLGPATEIVCCRSRDKARYARPGDVLVDDWEKHKSLWEGAGGVWITHRSAAETLRVLRELGIL